MNQGLTILQPARARIDALRDATQEFTRLQVAVTCTTGHTIVVINLHINSLRTPSRSSRILVEFRFPRPSVAPARALNASGFDSKGDREGRHDRAIGCN